MPGSTGEARGSFSLHSLRLAGPNAQGVVGVYWQPHVPSSIFPSKPKLARIAFNRLPRSALEPPASTLRPA